MLSDVLRFLVLALAAFDMGAIAVVIWLHWNAWRKAPRGMGLVPLHVWIIAMAHGGLIGLLLFSVMNNLREPVISFRVWFYIVCLMLTAGALVIIGVFQRRRVTSGKEDNSIIVRSTSTTELRE